MEPNIFYWRQRYHSQGSTLLGEDRLDLGWMDVKPHGERYYYYDFGPAAIHKATNNIGPCSSVSIVDRWNRYVTVWK